MGCSSIPRSRGLIIILFVFRGDAEPTAAVRVEPDAGEARAAAGLDGLAVDPARFLDADRRIVDAADAAARALLQPRPDIPRSRPYSSPTQGGTRPSPTAWSRSSCRHKNCCFRSCGKRCEWRLFCPSEIIPLSPAPVNVL